MIKVNYDISVLGSGYFLNRARTGIARVIENLAIELNTSPFVDLYLSSFQSLENFNKTREYLKNQEILDDSRLCGPGTLKGRTSLQFLEWYWPHYHQIQKKGGVSGKVARRLLGYMSRPVGLLERNIDLSFEKNCNVLHTPFLPFPATPEAASGICRFVTVYDLIPILFPQFFEFDESAHVRTVIKQISASDYVFAISECTKNDLCEYGEIDPDQVFVTPLAASETFRAIDDTDTIDLIKTKYKIPPEPYVLSLCTLEPRKNIDQTIKSFCELVKQQKIKDLNLVLVGTKGWDFDKIFNEIDRVAELQDRVVITGYVPDEDLAALYSGAMMFVYPSLYEGFGLPPLEAMQCGVPVITSNTSSLPEVVGDAGIMVDPKDGDQISQSMLALYQSKELCSELSNLGIKRAKQFSWKKCADVTISAYQLALNQTK